VKRPALPGITLQLIILFAAILALTQILSIAIRHGEQSASLAVLESIRIAERVSAIHRLLERTPADERQEVADYFTGSNIRVRWEPESRVPADTGPTGETRPLYEILEATLGQVPAEMRILQRPPREPAIGDSEGLPDLLPELAEDVADELSTGPSYVIALRLSDGSWLNISAAYAETLDFWSLESTAIVAAMVVAIGILAIWAIRRLTAPFLRFARAARQLGTDVNAPPLAPGGPAEVRLAVEAFNEMQTRIRRFVEDRTQMLAAISHDLRTPITRARLRVEFVDDAGERSRMIADFDEMERMIASVLDFAKADAGAEPTERVELVAMLQRICDEMNDRDLDASLEANGHFTLFCRPLAMRRCLTNLVENAIKYGKRARVGFGTGNGELAIHVDDDGPGIPEAQQEQAFRPFDRLERSRSRDGGGSGLGLTVARTIARAHGGDILMRNRAGGGLRVTLRLPLRD